MPGAADIPTSFGFATFLRIILPGITGSMLLLYSIMPLLDEGWDFWSVEAAFLILFGGFILGVILTSSDFYIYQFFEGFKFWLSRLVNWRYNIIFKNFKLYCEEYWYLKEIQDQRPLTTSEENKSSNNLYKLREFPYIPEKEYPLGRYPSRPTRLGNIMAEYESYSDKQYGMHMLKFWHQLWFLAPDEVRNFLDLKSAIADFLIYMSFLFIILAPITGACLASQSYVKYYSQIVLTMQIIPYQDLVVRVIVWLVIFIIIILISLFISYIFYLFAINALVVYGRNVKAFFDVYRFDLAEKLGVEIEIAPDSEEREKWQNLGHFLLDHEQYQRSSLPPKKRECNDDFTDW